MAADLSVTQEAHWVRQMCRHQIRRVICPPGRHLVPHYHHHQHLREPSLSRDADQGLPSVIPRSWWQSFTAVDGGRTWRISSGSIINSTLPPLRKQNGPGSRSGSLNTSSPIRRKLWPSKRTTPWTSWPTSRTFSIRPSTSIWMAWGASLVGSSGGAIIMDW